jgi:hypothetical protein
LRIAPTFPGLRDSASAHTAVGQSIRRPHTPLRLKVRINIEATPQDIAPAFDWIGGLIGGLLDQRVAALRQQARTNPLLTQHAGDIYALEFALADARRHRKSTGRLPKGDQYNLLYGFLVSASRIHAALPPEAIRPFKGQLAKAAGDANGLRPFAYELGIATHLMGKGWDVQFADYCGLGRFDLLARKGEVEIEVECKATSHDRGRKIHRREAIRLADLILPTIKRLMETPGCHLIRITVPDRLGSSNEELLSIAGLVADATQYEAEASNPFAQVNYIAGHLDSWPEPDDASFLPFFEQQFDLSNSHLLFCGRPGVSIVAVAIVSTKPDSVQKYIAGQVKEAADQCSGARPAIVAVNLADNLGRAELDELLRTRSGIHDIAAVVFSDAQRAHVDSIAFTVPQQAHVGGQGTTSIAGNLALLHNPTPKFACAEIRAVFRTAGALSIRREI